MTPLRQRLIEDMQLRNLSPETIKGYVALRGPVRQALRALARINSPPSTPASTSSICCEKKVSWSTFNQSVCALRFLYGTTLGRKDYVQRLPFGKKPKRIPVVLSRDEVLKFLQCILSRKQRMLLTTMYATGMRVGEAVQLSVTDIDSRRMTILVSRGKGNKQRLVPLSPKLLTELRLFWQTHRNPVWLFPSRRPDRPLSIAGRGEESAESQSPSRPETPLQHPRPAAHVRHGAAGSRSRSVLHSEDPGTPVAEHDGALHACAAQPSAGGLPVPGSVASGTAPPGSRRPHRRESQAAARSRRNHPPLRSRVPRQPADPA